MSIVTAGPSVNINTVTLSHANTNYQQRILSSGHKAGSFWLIDAIWVTADSKWEIVANLPSYQKITAS